MASLPSRQNQVRHRRPSRPRTARRLALEALERRTLLSGGRVGSSQASSTLATGDEPSPGADLSLSRATSRGPSLPPSLTDLDGDGRVGPGDYRIAVRDLVAQLRLRPISAGLDAASDPNHDGVVSGPHVVLVGQASRFATVRIDLNDDFVFDATTFADGLGQFRFSTDVGIGRTPILLQSTDRFGRSFLTALTVVRSEDSHPPGPAPDRGAPVVAVPGFPAGLRTSRNVTVTGTVADRAGRNSSGVRSLQARTDSGAFVGVPLGAGGRFSFATALALNGSADGPHRIVLRATDRAGNVATKTLTFTLATPDRRAPVITVRGFPPGLKTSRNVTVTGTVADRAGRNASGVRSLQARTDSGAFVGVPLGAGGRFSFATALALNGSADGPHRIVLRATDRAGNVATRTLTFTLATRSFTTLTLGLDPAFDTTPAGDRQTRFASVTLSGQTGPNAVVRLVGLNRSVRAGSDGRFAFANVALAEGPNTFRATTTNTLGNTLTADLTVTRVAPPAGTVTVSEAGRFASQATIPVDLGQAEGTRTLRFAVDAGVDATDRSAAVEDTLLVYLVDPSDPTKTLLDRGTPGTAVFALAGGEAEYTPGLVRFDGTNVEIDVTSLGGLSKGELVVQAINHDADDGSVYHILPVSSVVDAKGTESPRLGALAAAPAAAGPALDLSKLSASSSLRLVVGNVRLDGAGKYTAELRIRNDGPAAGRQVVATFPGLPAGVTLLDPSGTDAAGVPYISFSRVIPAGGLEAGATSDAIQVSFDDPAFARFVLRSRVLSGVANRAPTIAPVGTLTVMPGDCLELAGIASDPDGDPVTVTLRSPGKLPDGRVRSDGTIEFTPTPTDLGTYPLTIVASDGSVEATLDTTLNVVADPVTTTRISGVVQDTGQKPLANLPIEVGGVRTTTDASGRFQLDLGAGALPGDTLEVRGRDIPGNFPFIAEKLPLLLNHGVYAGLNNVICRPIYLPELNPGDTIDPNVDSTVSRVLRPGEAASQVSVAAQSLKDRQGNLYTGDLSITEVPVNLTPAALPDNLLPDLVVTIQPGEMVFTRPAPLTLPNRSGWEPGTMMDLWSINPVTGVFDKVGTGKVSADGSVIQTETGGIRNSSWHFFTPPPPDPDDPTADDNNEDNGPDEDPFCATGTSIVELHSGALIETHDLVTYQSLGQARGLSLVYDSMRADPRPIVSFGYSNVQANPSRRLVAKMVFNRGDFQFQVPGFEALASKSSGLAGGEHFWSIATSGSIRSALQADLSELPSGVYTYDLITGILQFNGGNFSGSTSTQTGRVVHVNGLGGVFGNGWGLRGLLQAVENPDGSVLLIDGDGSELLFGKPASSDQPYVSPAGDFTRLVKQADGTFQRTLTDATVQTFNADGFLAAARDRNGNQTQYVYGAPGRLEKVIDPVGLETRLTYTGNLVTQIVDPANRVTKLEYDAAGNLTRVTDPDGSHRTWGYDTLHHMTSEVDQRGFLEQDFYNAAGRVVRAILKDGSEMRYEPVQAQTVLAPDATIDPDKAPAARPKTEATGRYADASGHVTEAVLDKAGQVKTARDAEGLLPGAVRDAKNLIAATFDGRGFTTDYTYDDRGNVTSVTDRVGAVVGGSLFVTGHDSDDHGNGDYQRAGLDFLTFGHAASSPTEIALRAKVKVGYLGNTDGSNGGEAASGYTDRTFIDLDDANWPDAAFNSKFDVLMVGTGGDFVTSSGSAALNAAADKFAAYFNAGGGIFVNTDQASIGQGFYNFLPEFGATQAALGGQGVYSVTTDGLAIGLTEEVVDRDPTHTEYKNVDTNIFRVFERHNVSNDPVAIGLFQGFIGGGGIGGVSRRFYTYDPNFSRPTSFTDGQGRQTLYTIDPASGNTTRSTRVVGKADDATNGETDDIVTTYTYTSRGLVDTSTDPLGRVTDYDYDAAGNLAAVTYAKGTADEGIVRYEYDGTGNRTAVIDENGNRTDFLYDARNRLIRTKEADPDGAGPQVSPVTSYSYDTAGNLTATTDARGNTTRREYDARNGLVRLISPDPDGAGPLSTPVTRYSYDSQGNLTAVVDPLLHATSRLYDDRNRVIETTDPDGGVTKFRYDGDDNLTSVIDPDGNETKFVYDSRDRLVQETDPLGKMINYAYDASDNLIKKTDRNGRVVSYAYDALSRPITETWEVTGQPAADVIVYKYDTAGNLLSLGDSFSTLVMSYDGRNRLKTVDNDGTPGSPRVVLSYTYDRARNPVSVSDTINGVAGAVTSYTFDAISRMTRITQAGAGVADKRVDISYNPIGQPTSLNRFADLTGSRLVAGTSYSYDALGQIDSITHRSAGGTTLDFESLSYDVGGRILRVADPDGATDYTYDSLGQLTASDHSNTADPDEIYAYDPAGNRTSSSLHNGGYQTSPGNRLLSDGTFTYAYDDEGNLIKRTENATGKIREFAWDYRNRLTGVIDKASDGTVTQNVRYVYDAFNRRISKTVDTSPGDATPAVTTHFVYDRANVILDFTDADGAGPGLPILSERYLHGPAVDQLLAQEDGGRRILWTLADHLGTIDDLVDNTSVAVNHFDYDSFGNLLSKTNTTADSRYLFTGREFDSETSMYYHRARYVDSTSGRFLSEDPIRLDGGDSNLYRYVFNAPTMLRDASGKGPLGQAVGGAIGTGIGFVGGGALGAALGGGGGTLVAPGVGTIAGGISGADAGAAAGAVTGGLVGAGIGDFLEDAIRDLLGPLFSKGGKQNELDTGLQGESDEEVSRKARDKSLSGEERRRYQKEEKARGLRNKQKRCQ